MLHIYYITELTPSERIVLAEAIMPYLARTYLLLPQAVRTISTNYLRDSARIRHLMHSPTSIEWNKVLEQVMSYAARQSHFTNIAKVTDQPAVDLYTQIQCQLASYNFEEAFDHWITVAVAKSLRRRWHERQTLPLASSSCGSR